MHLHSSDVMSSSTKRAFSAFATALRGLRAHQQRFNTPPCVSVLGVGQQRVLHALQQQVCTAPTVRSTHLQYCRSAVLEGTHTTGPMLLQCGTHPRVHGCAQGVSSPRHMVSLLPGQCRGAALEVDELADIHGGPTPADQGTTRLQQMTVLDRSAVQAHKNQGLKSPMQMLNYSTWSASRAIPQPAPRRGSNRPCRRESGLPATTPSWQRVCTSCGIAGYLQRLTRCDHRT